ncbi:TRAP transporter small permease subunit [Aurantimonas sp. C2-6-R+9]|uniref:TRAP transporter small permease subunit n=1 Tax=unclassified Aurantimonas TaxID=2638230 RepID=UPI002E18BAD0|nr:MULTISPECIES: TRAP transporter small permease subunit [unclassified Aurantimonas]MEC5293170.1 TRAP transporter small permease subunit [Aurantimonas sp. C2-3-R2]MEC5383488.1 TRAP transporter small permease subunit [Aurantimonas sp. C2-6-R+9]MEC5414264.1 TRAP transporter small permease subunit [Aurantimonas sp. C2-4-R8]
MAQGLIRIADQAERLVRVIGHVAAWSAVLLVLLVAGNVLARYLLGFSNVASQELEWHVMAFGALFGMAYGINQGAEVRVDVLYERFDPRTRLIVDLLGTIGLFVVSLALAWFAVGYTLQSYAMNEGSPDPGGLSQRYLLKGLLPVAFLLLAIQAAGMTLVNIARLIAPADLRSE